MMVGKLTNSKMIRQHLSTIIICFEISIFPCFSIFFYHPEGEVDFESIVKYIYICNSPDIDNRTIMVLVTFYSNLDS